MPSNQLVCVQQRFAPSQELIRALRTAHAGPGWLSRMVHRLYCCTMGQNLGADTLRRAVERSLDSIMRREGDGYEIVLGPKRLFQLSVEIERRLPILDARGRIAVAAKVVAALKQDLAMGRQVFTPHNSVHISDGHVCVRSLQAPADTPSWLTRMMRLPTR